jgi:hypothetical protein
MMKIFCERKKTKTTSTGNNVETVKNFLEDK